MCQKAFSTGFVNPFQYDKLKEFADNNLGLMKMA